MKSGSTMWGFIFLAALCATMIFTSAAADEFSGDRLAAGWRLEKGDTASKQTLINGLVGLINAEGTPQNAKDDLGVKLLRGQIEGDWTIETQIIDIDCADASGAYGLIVYAGSGDYLALARTQSGVNAYAVVGGVLHELANADDRPFLRIKRITRASLIPTYALYTSETPTGAWNYIGSYTDAANALADAEYGLFASGAQKGYATFDFFTEAVLDAVYDDFNTAALDGGFWRRTREATISTGGTLNAQFTSFGDASSFLMRDAMGENWIIDTRLTLRPTADDAVIGLSLQSGNDEILFGAKGRNTVGAVAVINGMESELFSVRDGGMWLRVTKDQNEYSFSSSYDGVEWNVCGEYIDEEARFEHTAYGLGCRGGSAFLRVQYDFFRERPLPDGVIRGVEFIDEIGQLIGSSGYNLINETMSVFNVNGADIGNMVDAGDKIYLMFGDTFSGYKTGSWRANTLAIVTDTDPSDGLTIDTYITDIKGNAKEVISSRHVDYEDITSIPTNGIYIDGRLYYHFFSVFHWGAASHWDCNYSAWAYSDDGGNTFTKATPFWGKDTNFIHVAILEQNDFIYIYGIPSGRFGAVKLMRVPKADILTKDAYRYYAGKDEQGADKWVESEYDAVAITPAYTGELSVVYNEAIDRYMMIYLNENTFDIELRESENVTGPWSAPVTLVDHNIDQYCQWVNCPYMLRRFVNSDGSFYFTLSKGTPYCVFFEYVQLQIAE